MTAQRPTKARTQYRVLSKRVGNNVTAKTFGTLKAAENRLGLLTSTEPWRFYGTPEERQRGGDEYRCCDGTPRRECGCGGETVREHAMAGRANLPLLEWARIEQRTITASPWAAVSDPQQKAK